MEPTDIQALKQEVFNKVARHLKKQKVRSVDDKGQCRYRVKMVDGRNLKCAVGVLIDDKDYNVGMEGETVRTLLVKGFSVFPNAHHCKELLSNLQSIHDWSAPENWPRHLKAVAEKHALETPKFLR